MRKLKIFAAAAATMSTVMFCAPAFAEDRLSLSGSMRVRAHDIETSKGGESSYFDQRFRLGTKIRVSDDVYAELRADYTEGTWGKDFGEGEGGLIVRPNRGTSSAIDIDRAFLNISKEMWALRAGQQYMSLGIAQVLDANDTGAKFDLKFSPVTATALYAKVSENGDTNDEDAFDDEDMYGLNINYACDAFSADLFAATITDGTPVDYSPVAFGAHVTASLGIVNLVSELAMFSGDTDDGVTDLVGTQFYLGADANVTDSLNVGAQLLYAPGTTESNEKQITSLCNWWSFTPMLNKTPWDADDSFDPNDGNPFDPAGSSAGVQGMLVEGKFIAMDSLSLGGKVGYFTPEEDDATNLDSLTSFFVWAEYGFATNTTFTVAYLHVDPDVDDVAGTESHTYWNDGEAYQHFMARLQVAF